MRLLTLFSTGPTDEERDEDSVIVSDDFKHETLPNAHTHIRLLRIIDARDGQPARCTLSVHPLDVTPPYSAISYTWGDPADAIDIVINKKRKVVRRNCEYVLQQAFASDRKAYYWIDAICIDQENNDEKSSQVAMMGDLYRKATKVLACVGPQADDSDFLFDFLKSHKSFFRRHYKRNVLAKSANLETDNSLSRLGGNYQDSRELWRLLGGWRALLLERTRLWLAYMQLLKRPYFSRVWVLQELFSGYGRILFCCGMKQSLSQSLLVLDGLIDTRGRPDSTIQSLILSLEKVIWRRRFHGTRSIGYTSIDYDSASRSLYKALHSQRRYILISARPQSHLIQLQELLDFLSQLQCEDTRDRIYGTRSIVDWPEGSAPVPDYEKGRFMLSKEIVDLLLSAKPSQNLAWYKWSMTRLAKNIQRSLLSTPDEAMFEQCIQSRLYTTVIHEDFPPRSLKRRVGDICWRGLKISEHFALKHGEGYTELSDKHWDMHANFAPKFWGPRNISSKDWVITRERPRMTVDGEGSFLEQGPHPVLFMGDQSFVLRLHPSGRRYLIVGPVYTKRSGGIYRSSWSHWERFIIFWDAEDLLVHDWRDSPVDWAKEANEQTDMLYGRRFSRIEGASYAIGPFSAQEIRAKLENDPDTTLLEPE